MEKDHQLSIWLFVGGMLTVYGLLILGSGIWSAFSPPPLLDRVKLYELHADIWWGAIMVIVGIIYCVKFRPSDENTK